MAELTSLIVEIKKDGVDEASRSLDKFSQSADKAEGKSEELGDASKQTSSEFDGLSDAVKLTAAGIAGGLVAAITLAIIESDKLQRSINDLAITSGGTASEIKRYEDAARELGRSTAISAEQIAVGMENIADEFQFEGTGENIESLSRKIIVLAQAVGTDLSEASDAVAVTLQKFSLSADSTGAVVDLLASASKGSASRLAEFTGALSSSAVAAKASGISLGETAAAIKVLDAAGIKGSEAGSQLSKILIELSGQADYKINPSIVGMAAAFEELHKRNLTLNDSVKTFGKFSFEAGAAITANAGKLRELSSEASTAGEAHRIAAIKTDNLSNSLKILGNNTKDLAVNVGDSLTPAAILLIESLSGLTEYAKAAYAEFTDLGDLLGSYAAIAAAVFAGDFDGVKSIVEARKEHRSETEKTVEAILTQAAAVETLKNAEKGLTDQRSDQSRITLPATEIDGKKIKTAVSDFEGLQADLQTEEEAIRQTYENRLAIIAEYESISEDNRSEVADARYRAEADQNDALRVLEDERNEYKVQAAADVESKIQSLQSGTVSQAINLLQVFAGKNKAAAIAAIALSKGVAIAKVIQERGVAVVAALKLPPGIREGSIAEIEAVSAVQIGLIAATGLAQAAGVGSGGGSSGGGGGGSVGDGSTSQQRQPNFSTDSGGSNSGGDIVVNVRVDGSIVGASLSTIVADALREADRLDQINIRIGNDRVRVE